MDQKEIVIIGAGVVGCAVAHILSKNGYNPIVIEAGPRIAEGVTSRNSGVIHAGLYYPPHSLKALACIEGNALLYEWCQAHQVPHLKTGKWIVGSQNEESELEELYQNAITCGAKGVRRVPSSEIDFSGIDAQCALYSSETGIVDPYLLSRSLQISAEEYGATFVMNTRVLELNKFRDQWMIKTSNGTIDAELVINCAGLESDTIAKLAGCQDYQITPWAGDYFRIKNYTKKINHLIYPIKKKNAAGLGVHLTLGLDGSMKLGPDVQLSSGKYEYSISEIEIETKKNAFFAAAKKFLPDLKIENLEYDSRGIRPKLRGPNDAIEKDFVIHNANGGIHLIGIESPGLTSALSLANKVLKLL